ncbi:MAG: hypothetical protein ACD_75C00937G0003 [uncultured bacterium]|nr:MAG: hypothetical protein ACD_75C00937G0003 [uncultured bacterium]
MQPDRALLQHCQGNALCFKTAFCQEHFNDLERRFILVKFREKVLFKDWIDSFR